MRAVERWAERRHADRVPGEVAQRLAGRSHRGRVRAQRRWWFSVCEAEEARSGAA